MFRGGGETETNRARKSKILFVRAEVKIIGFNITEVNNIEFMFYRLPNFENIN